MRRTRVLLALAVLSLGAVAVWALVVEPATTRPGVTQQGEVIARVDGVPITLEQARARVEGIRDAHAQDFDETEWRPAILDSLVSDVVIAQEAAARGLVVTEDDLDDGVDDIRTLFSDPDGFVGWLHEQEIDEAELRRRLSVQLLAARVYASLTAEVTVSEEEVESYYEENQDRFVAHDGPRPLVEVRPDLEAELVKAAKDAAFDAWLSERRAAANVEVLHDDWR